MEKQEVVQAVKQELANIYGKRFAKILLYGSYARGDFSDDSDIDFLVVFNED